MLVGIAQLPWEIQECVLVEWLRRCRACDVLDAMLELQGPLPACVVGLYSLVVETGRVYLRLQRPGLAYIDLGTEWTKLEKLVALLARSPGMVRWLVVQDAISHLSMRAFALLEPLALSIKYEHQLGGTLGGFVDLVRAVGCEDKVRTIEANEINFANDWPLVSRVLTGRLFRRVHRVHLLMYSDAIRQVLDTITQDENSPQVVVSTTLSLNPLVPSDMSMISFLKRAKSEFHNLQINYTLTVPTLDSMEDVWDQLDFSSVTKLVLQNTCARFHYSFLKGSLDRFTRCSSLCIYVNSISTEYLNRHLPKSVSKLTLIFREFVGSSTERWVVPGNVGELNLFSRGSVMDLEQLLRDMDWTQSNVRGLSLEYQYNTRSLDRTLHITLPETLEQLDVSSFSESMTLICAALPPILAQEGKLKCGAQTPGLVLVGSGGESVQLVSSTKRMVAI